MSEKEKKEYVDDGHTIFSMDVDAKWANQHSNKKSIYVTKDERKALIKAAFRSYFPKLLIVFIGFGLAIILIYFWLK